MIIQLEFSMENFVEKEAQKPMHSNKKQHFNWR